MSHKRKQENLKGIEANMATLSSFTDAVFQIVDAKTLTTLANEIDVDKGSLSRFKNGETGLTLEKLDKLLDCGDFILLSKKRYKRLFTTIITHAEITKEALGL